LELVFGEKYNNQFHTQKNLEFGITAKICIQGWANFLISSLQAVRNIASTRKSESMINKTEHAVHSYAAGKG